MTLTLKDLFATLLTLGVGGVWYAYIKGMSLPLVGSTRWTLVLLFVVGMVLCGLGTPNTASGTNPWIVVASGLGIVALVIVLWGLISGAKITVTLLAGTITLLWLITTVRHLLNL